MSYIKAIELIENSFLSPLLEDEEVTDVSFNGKNLFYQHNLHGRKRFEYELSNNVAFDFVRQIANLCGKLFSISDPILDVSIGKYRFNAVHPCISRFGFEKTITFSIRISSIKIRIKDDNSFMPNYLKTVLKAIIRNNYSLIISGLPGTGKTELQKYLLSLMENNTRLIVIDNVLEFQNTDAYDHLDLNMWQYDDKQNVTVDDLIKNALRCNPDWLIIAEARASEMMQVYRSILTGNPIIMTMHSESIDSIVSRMESMIKISDKNLNLDSFINDINLHIHFYIFISKFIDKKGTILRKITNVNYVDKNGTTTVIYNYFKNKEKVNVTKKIASLLSIRATTREKNK